ncbi:MAG: tetratricopeptide repeat protein [Nitrospirae bacterium]|nr:tetratricopeptide repeat protein [Nitrospirota bacterium]
MRRIGRLLEIADGFQLFIAEFNDPLFRKKIIEEISAFGVKATVLEVDRRKFPKFNDFEKKIAQLSKEYKIIHVIDLDTWLKMDEGDRMVLGFNYHREGIARTCNASLFLWMTELGIYSFMTTIPDMWSWRSAVLSFLIEKEKTIGSPLADKGYDYIKAMPLQRRLARIKEIEEYLKAPPPDLERRLLAELHKELGKLYIHLGTRDGLQKGMGYFERALKIDIDLYGERHQSVVEDYNNIGSAWDSLGESEKALEYFEKALKIYIDVKGENYLTVATLYNNMGLTWDKLGDSKKALEFYEKALKIDLILFGESHPNVAIRYNNIGLAWINLGEYSKALVYCEKALKIDLTLYGESHPNIAIRYNNIGLAWEKIGESKKAQDYYERALEIDLKVYGENHPNIANRYNNIGSTWYRLGELRKALEYYEKALEIDLKVYGDKHPGIAYDYNNIGMAWKRLGASKQALKYLEKALKISRGFYKDNHLHVMKIRNNINLLQKPNPQ